MAAAHTRPKPLRSILAVFAVLVLAVAGCADEGAAPADDTAGDDPGEEPDTAEAEAFYEGETLTIVVPFSPGGGYDTYARMLAPYMEEETGANVVVENQEGAGGLLAINQLLTDRSEGLRIAIMNAIGAGGAAIADAEGPEFELDELSYIGRVGQEPHLLVVGADTSYESFDDVVAADAFRFGSTGPGGADFVNPSVLIETFDLDAEIITGFEGSSENELAVTRGDVDGMTGDFDSRIGAVEDGDHRPLLLINDERHDVLPDVSTILEEDLDDDQRTIVEAHLDLLALGRPFVAPPDVPADRLQFLREALERAMNNPELIEESESQGRPLGYLSGEEMDELVESLLDAPEEYREVLERAYEG
jgi:tripartite-type tricarboxylate transporter receptor subunit TctC